MVVISEAAAEASPFSFSEQADIERGGVFHAEEEGAEDDEVETCQITTQDKNQSAKSSCQRNSHQIRAKARKRDSPSARGPEMDSKKHSHRHKERR